MTKEYRLDMAAINNDWLDALNGEFKKDYYINLRELLKKEYSTRVIYPNMYNIFEALKHTSYKDTKVLILGQDPYHGENQAHGLAFSVQPGVKTPPSLLLITKTAKQVKTVSASSLTISIFLFRVTYLRACMFPMTSALKVRKTAMLLPPPVT